jgi:hypothetical protein
MNPYCNLGRMKPLFVLAVFIFPAWAARQELPSTDVLLDRLDAYTKQYQATLPSLSCDEQITSQALNKKGKVTWEMRIQSTLREVRTGDSEDYPFVEQHEFKSVDERRAKATFRTSQMPYFAEGGFASLVGFKGWEQRECFDYAVSSGDGGHTVRVEMTLKADSAKASCARLPLDFHRIAIADPETGRIFHTERTIAPEEAAMSEGVYFGGIDYAPQKFGEQTFWLPTRFYAHDAENRKRMVATYSNCHRYTGELKILPGGVTQGPH